MSHLRYQNRWLCYFDLLGFKRLIYNGDEEAVIRLYGQITENLSRRVTNTENWNISYSWFSDTFIIFSRRDTPEEFGHVERSARKFFVSLLLARIPVRGAISFGRLYTQKEKNIFLGPALVQAYEYGEKQNWLGLLLAPSVSEKLGQVPDSYRAPHDRTVIIHPNPSDVYAYGFSDLPERDTTAVLDSLRSMREAAPEEYKIKYENIENFIALQSRAGRSTVKVASGARRLRLPRFEGVEKR